MDTTLFNISAQTTLADIWFPTDATSENLVDPPMFFILVICAIFTLFNAGLMVFFAIRYKQKNKAGTASGSTHNTALEVTWSIIPAFILAIIFIWGFRNFLVMATPPENSYDILVTGYKWGWDFTYDEGFNAKPERDAAGNPMPPALHAPANRPVRLTLQSQDVLHSVFIPQLRVKKDVVPGRFNQMWFEAEFNEATAESVDLPTEDGSTVTVKRNVYDLFCTEYCGQNHSMMITKVYVYQPDDYELWKASATLYDPSLPVSDLGETIWATQCKACHSLDGSSGLGPTWQDLYMQPNHGTSAGPLLADDAYIIESIRNPAAKIADGYGNQMAAFPNLTEREVRGIIEYMKTISVHAEADEGLTYGDLNIDGTVKGEAGEESGEGEASSEAEATPVE